MMAKTGLLVVSNPARVVGLLPQLQKHVLNKLYIQYLPDRFTRLLPQGGQGQVTASQQVHPPTYGPVVIGLYRQSLAHNIDITVLLGGFKDPFLSVINNKKPIEVVFFDQVFNGEEVNTFLKSYLPNVHSDCKVVSIADGGEGAVVFESGNPTEHQVDKVYDNVVLGGTFDRLHAGHKVLLSEAVLRCQKRLTVGVTDENMLKSKILWEIVQPCELRIALVREFLEEICPSLEYNVVPISDAFGPTKDDPELDMIVVSAETLKGGLKVNEVRAAKSLCNLDIHAVDLLLLKEKQENEEDKVSSSNIRMRLLGKRLQIPPENTKIPRKPYVIGLTGGIASGKSSVSEKLGKLGAPVINCDLLAHDLYKKGEPLLQKLVDHFGEEILDSNGEVNRKALGSIVFNNEEQRQKLNNLVWPALLERVKDEISKLFSAGRDVVFVEAAVLLQAGWASHCHEVWVCLVPPEEAIKRLQKRNDLSEADAAARVKAQPSNQEHVRLATVVFCTLWSHDYTQKQVAQAWNDLQKHLKLRAGKL